MNKKIILGLVGVPVLALTVTFNSYASGTATDPLISKSYFDEIVQGLQSKINALEIKVDNAQNVNVIDNGNNNNNNGSGNNSSIDTSEFKYVPVSAVKGQSILGGEGCEIILRSGDCIAKSTSNGVVNATTGAELYNGTGIPANNIIIVPRNDGRGVTVTSEEAWFIIKGTYTIK